MKKGNAPRKRTLKFEGQFAENERKRVKGGIPSGWPSRIFLQREREKQKTFFPSPVVKIERTQLTPRMAKSEFQKTALRRIMSWVKTRVCSPMNLAPDWMNTSRFERLDLTDSISSAQKGLTKVFKLSLFWGS